MTTARGAGFDEVDLTGLAVVEEMRPEGFARSPVDRRHRCGRSSSAGGGGSAGCRSHQVQVPVVDAGWFAIGCELHRHLRSIERSLTVRYIEQWQQLFGFDQINRLSIELRSAQVNHTFLLMLFTGTLATFGL